MLISPLIASATHTFTGNLLKWYLLMLFDMSFVSPLSHITRCFLCRCNIPACLCIWWCGRESYCLPVMNALPVVSWLGLLLFILEWKLSTGTSMPAASFNQPVKPVVLQSLSARANFSATALVLNVRLHSVNHLFLSPSKAFKILCERFILASGAA